MADNGIPIPPGQANQGNTVLAVDLVCFTISTIFVVLRVGTRLGITRNFGWDDATIIVAQVLTTVGKVFIIEEVANGFGQHRSAVTAGTYSKFLKFNYLDWAQTMIVLAVSKISICLFLLRLSQFSRLTLVLYGVIALITISHIPIFLAYVLQCDPVSNNWNMAEAGSCFSKNAVEAIIITQGAFSILIDFICAAFPIVLLRNTNISIRGRVALCVLMGLGFITGVICIVRTAFSWQVKSDDLSWVETPNALARILEVNLGIACACAPIMKPFVQYVHASVTGNDPYDLLSRGKGQRSVSHAGWRHNIRISPPSPPAIRLDSRRPRKLPAAVHKMSYQPDHVFDPPSIVLPIQGTSLEPRNPKYKQAAPKALASRPRQGQRGGQMQRARQEEVWEGDDSLEKSIMAAVGRRRNY